MPETRIVVAASGFSLDVLRHNPNIDSLIETPSPLKDLKSAVRSLRRQFPSSFRRSTFATLTPMGNERTLIALQALLSGASTRVGFTVQPELYRVPMTFDVAKSQIANNLRIVEVFGQAPAHVEPEIFFSEQDIAAARETLVASGFESGQPIAVLITQTSVTQRKSWRAERFREAAVFLKERYGAYILFAGTAAESQAIDELRSGLPFPTTSVAGKTTLPQLAALMSLCNIGLTLDTGPLHVGRAVGLPMVVIAPAWSPPVEWLPVDDPRYRILKNATMPSEAPDYIIDEVSVDDVTVALMDLMENSAGLKRPDRLSRSA